MSLKFKVDELTDWHEMIDSDWLGYGNFKCPVIAKAHVSFSCRCVDVNSESSDATLPFEERYMLVSFCVLFCDS